MGADCDSFFCSNGSVGVCPWEVDEKHVFFFFAIKMHSLNVIGNWNTAVNNGD